MKRLIAFTAGVACLAFSVGCGSPQPDDSAMRKIMGGPPIPPGQQKAAQENQKRSAIANSAKGAMGQKPPGAQ